MPQTKIIYIGYNIWLYVRNEGRAKHNIFHCHAIMGKNPDRPQGAATICLKNYKNIKAGEILESFGFGKKMLKHISESTLLNLKALLEKWEEYNHD